MVQSEPVVRRTLEQLVAQVRSLDYRVPREYGPFLVAMGGSLCYAMRGAWMRSFQKVAESAMECAGVQRGEVVDWCCGSGGKTIRLARWFPQARFYGFDIHASRIAKAQRRAQQVGRECRNVSFERKDIYNWEGGGALAALLFNKACGPLADQILYRGTRQGVPLIVGRFCCYHTISSETAVSRSRVTNGFLEVMAFGYERMRKKHGESFIAPPRTANRDLLSDFARFDLGVTEREFERIAGLSVDASVGYKIVDLNRMMKLFERGYAVWFDEEDRILVARKCSA